MYYFLKHKDGTITKHNQPCVAFLRSEEEEYHDVEAVGLVKGVARNDFWYDKVREVVGDIFWFEDGTSLGEKYLANDGQYWTEWQSDDDQVVWTTTKLLKHSWFLAFALVRAPTEFDVARFHELEEALKEYFTLREMLFIGSCLQGDNLDGSGPHMAGQGVAFFNKELFEYFNKLNFKVVKKEKFTGWEPTPVRWNPNSCPSNFNKAIEWLITKRKASLI